MTNIPFYYDPEIITHFPKLSGGVLLGSGLNKSIFLQSPVISLFFLRDLCG